MSMNYIPTIVFDHPPINGNGNGNGNAATPGKGGAILDFETNPYFLPKC